MPAAAGSDATPGRAGDAARDRRRIFGLETEYLILYRPDDPTADPPRFSTIESVIFDSLLKGRRAVRSSGAKGGYFLQNGGLVHLELFRFEQSDTPILEASTPECSSPRDLVISQRAFDRIVSEIGEGSPAALRGWGHRGRINFGKNNLDARGVGYGCHENYLVRFRPSRWHKALLAAATPVLLLLIVPAFLFAVSLVLFLLVLLSASLAISLALVPVWLLLAVLNLSEPTLRGLRSVRAGIARVAVGLRGRRLREIATAGVFHLVNALLLPFIVGFNVLLRWIAYPRFVAALTPFLVSRTALCGAGRLDPRTGRFELSQRAPLTRAVSGIFMYGSRKVMFDLKAFLYSPFDLLREQRRLTIFLGDSNPSDLPNLLKVGTTGLILEMIEAGVRFDDLALRRPVHAFRQVSRDGPWKQLAMRDARRGTMSALELQREYLRRARAYWREVGETGPVDYGEILRAWGSCLDAFEDGFAALSSRLDWCAKKTLLDSAVLSRSNWLSFAKWARVLSRIPPATLADWAHHVERREAGTADPAGEDLDRALGACRPRVRRRVRRSIDRDDLDAREFSGMVLLHYQCRKIDLRYHELGGYPGYQRQLEAAGQLDRWTRDADVERAMHEPPARTRATLRGHYIRELDTSGRLRASWGDVFDPRSQQRFDLSDPFRDAPADSSDSETDATGQ